MKSTLLIVSCLLLIAVNVSTLSVSDLIDDLTKELGDQFGNETEGSDVVDEKLSKALDEVAKEILRSMSSVSGEGEDGDLLSDQSKDRGRRSESPYQTVVGGLKRPSDGVSRLRGIHPTVGTCDYPIRLSVITYNGVSIAACVSVSPVPEIVIGELSLTAFTPRIRLQTVRSPTGSAAFVDKDRLFVMVADAARSDGIDLHVITKTFGIKSEHVTSSHYPTAISVWKPSSDAPFHLAIANSPGPSLRSVGGNTFRNLTTFYKWTGTYFDSYTQVNSFHVKDICPFSVAGKDYVVIVNHESSPGFYSVDSELYRFDPDEYKWYSIQKIKTTGAVDCEVFTLGPDNNQEFFLTIANHVDKDVSTGSVRFDVDSVIYKFSNDKFVPFQCLKTVGATAVKAFEDSPSSFLLAVAHVSGLQLFQYNGWKFVQAPVQLTRASLGPGLLSFLSTRVQGEPVLIVANPRMSAREGNVIRFEFVHEDPVRSWKKSSQEWCEGVSRKMNDGHSTLDSIHSLLEGTFAVDQREPIVVKGDVTVTGANLTVHGFFRSPSLEDVSRGELFSHALIQELDSLHNQLVQLESEISSLSHTLNRAVTVDGNQVITGLYSFSHLTLHCSHEDRCLFDSVNANTLNGDDISTLPISLVYTNKDQILSEDLILDHVSVSGDLFVQGTVNGVSTSKLVLKNGNHLIPSPTTFSGPTSSTHLFVQGLINGLVLNNRTILTRSGDQVVNSNIVLNAGLNVLNLNARRVNGVELSPLLEDIVTVDGDHSIRGRKNFSSIRVRDVNLLPGGKISGVDLSDLWKNLLWTKGDQSLHAPLSFTDASLSSHLRADKLVNNILIPNNDILLVNRSAVITGMKTFLAPSTLVDFMTVTHSINGIKRVDTGYTQWPDQLDILVKNRVQTCPVMKSFQSGLHLSTHSTLTGTIDGVDLSHFAQSVLKRNSTNFLSGNWILSGDSVIFKNRVSLGGLVDGSNLTHLYWNSLKLTDKVIPNFAPFHFSSLSSPQFKLRTLNRMVIERDLMTKNTRQMIVGGKTFPSGLQVENVTIVGLFNGIEMRFLSDSLLRSGNQSVWGEKVVQGDVYVESLILNRGVNGISLSDVILVNSSIPQVVSGKKTFNSLTLHGLDVTRVEIEKEVNGVGVNDLFRGTMLFDEPQVVTGFKHFSKISIPSGSDLETSSVNGYNLKRIYWDAVLLDQPQTISGEKTFKGSVSFHHLIFHRHFDSVTDHDLRYNWMLQGVNQVLHGDLVFNLGLSLNNHLDILNGTINGIHVQDLNRTIVKKNEPTIIDGQVTFAQQVSVNGDVSVTGTTQGIKLSKEVLTRNKDATIYGKKRFLADVDVDTLAANGLVNGVFVPELCSSAVRTVGDQVIRSHTLIRGNVTFERSLSTDGRIDGVDLNHFNISAVKVNEPAIVHGRKGFSQLVLVSPLTVRGSFGGLDLKRLQSDYMSLSQDQIINTPLLFSHGISILSASVHGSLFLKDGLVNNVSLRDIDRNSLKLFGDQTISGPVIFSSDVRTKSDLKFMNQSVINGVSVFEDLFLKNRPRNVVRGGLVFDSNVELSRNLEMAGGQGIQGVDVSEVYRHMVMGRGDQTVEGHKHFSSLEVDDISVSGTISGLHFSPAHILLASASQEIEGTVTFSRGIRLFSHLHVHLVNHLNLNTWTRRLVLNGANNTIQGRLSFLGPVNGRQTWVMGLIDGVHLTSLRNSMVHSFDTSQLKSLLSFQEKKINVLDRVLRSRAIRLDHYRSEWTLPESLLKSAEFGAKKFILTKRSDSSSCSSVNLYSLSTKTLSILTSVKSYNPVLSSVFKMKGRIFVLLITGRIRDPDSARRCIQDGLSVGSGSSLIQVLSHDSVTKKLNQVNLLPIESIVTDVKIVSLTDKEICFAISVPFVSTPSGSSLSDPRMICLDSNGKKIPLKKERIGGKGGNRLSVHVSPAVTFLAVSSVETSFVTLLSWDHKSRSLSNSLQHIHVTSPTTVTFVTTSIQEGSQVFFFVGASNLIQVFKFIPTSKSSPFSQVQQIAVKDSIVSIESVLLPDHSTLLVTLFTNGEVKLFTYKGSSGFVPFTDIDPVVSKSTTLSVIPTFTNMKLTGHVIAVNRRMISMYEESETESETVLLSSVLTY